MVREANPMFQNDGREWLSRLPCCRLRAAVGCVALVAATSASALTTVEITGVPASADPGSTLDLEIAYARDGQDEERRIVLLAEVFNAATDERLQQFVFNNSDNGYTQLSASLPFSYSIPADFEGGLYIQGRAVPWSLARAVVAQLESYPTDGTFTYDWDSSRPGDYGVTQAVIYLGVTICPDYPGNTTYCSGVAFETFLVGWNNYNAQYGHAQIGAVTATQMSALRRVWYGITDAEKLAARAIPEYGLGLEITDFEEFQKGDFVQLWRTVSGHNPLFINWVRDSENQIIGLRYWGSQSRSNGIGYATEYFTGHGGSINPARVYAARPRKPRDQADYDWTIALWENANTPVLVGVPRTGDAWAVR